MSAPEENAYELQSGGVIEMLEKLPEKSCSSQKSLVVFKAKPASKTARVLPMKKFKEMVN